MKNKRDENKRKTKKLIGGKMKKVMLITILLSLFLVLPVVAGAQITFERWYGGTGSDFGYSVQQTTDGGYIIAGYTESFGAGSGDVYLIKTDADGDSLWTKTYGGTGNDDGWSVQQTTDGGYIIAGSTMSMETYIANVYLIKTNSSGDTLWTRTYGGTAKDFGVSVQQTSDDGYIVAGKTKSYGAGSGDVYLIKTDADGDTIWTRTYGGSNDEAGKSVQQTSDGGYIIAGYKDYGGWDCDVYLIKTNSSGDTLWTRTYGGGDREWGHSVQQTSDGGYIIAGYTASFGAGFKDVYLIKTDTDGDTLWTKTYGGTDDDYGMSVQQTTDGGYIITGYTVSYGQGLIDDVYLIKTDASGGTLWTRTYGGPSLDGGYSVQQTSDEGYIIAGWSCDIEENADVYLIKTDGGGFLDIDNEHLSTNNCHLFQNHPNPFNSNTTISYNLKEPGEVIISIYNVRGQLIKKLVNGQQSIGRHSVVWDGKDENGETVSSGIYLYEIKSDRFEDTGKMILLK
jgi:hypothetical protein